MSTLHYGGEAIAYRVQLSARPARKLTIKVQPDGQVVVVAPADSSAEQIAAGVSKRARWIWEQLQPIRERLLHVRPRQYISGETHFYLGKRYPLKVSEDARAPQQVKLLRGMLCISLHQNRPEKVRELLFAWYRARAREQFSQRLERLSTQVRWLTHKPALRLQTMQTQWGSCSHSGTLTLNPHLVKAPPECIDYVLLHELCHLAEHNHSDAFWRLLGQVMPDWQPIKERLDAMVELYLNDVSG